MRIGFSLLLALLLGACGKPALYQQESYVFGTRVTLSIAGVEEETARQAAAEALAELDRLHAKLHSSRPSAVTRLNEAFARGESAPVDAELAGMLHQAADFARKSDQLFNPAVGNLVALWGFHRDTYEPVVPDASKLAALLAAKPSLDDLSFDGDRVASRNRSVALDLGGFAKGWALDRVAVGLRSRGIRNALINIGGNVLALGSKGGAPWRVGLQHPRKPAPMATIELKDGEAIGTSGDYQRFFERNGKRYSHLIDPRNGQPASAAQAATVIAAGPGAGTLSDVATKSLFVGGSGTALKYAKRFGLNDVLLVEADGTVRTTRSLRARIAWLEKPAHLSLLE